MSTEAKCPFYQASGAGTSNKDWWPNQLRVDLLNQHSGKSNLLGEGFTTLKPSKHWTTPRSRRTSSS